MFEVNRQPCTFACRLRLTNFCILLFCYPMDTDPIARGFCHRGTTERSVFPHCSWPSYPATSYLPLWQNPLAIGSVHWCRILSYYVLIFSGTNSDSYLTLKCGSKSCRAELDKSGNDFYGCSTDTYKGDDLRDCKNFQCDKSTLTVKLELDGGDDWFIDWVE